MRIERFSIQHIGPFKERVDVDLSGIAGLLVAFTGANGAGKSVSLETAFPGVMYRRTPTRGTLAALATDRDSFVEARIVNGAAYTIRQSVDAMDGSGTSLVLDADGKSVLSSTSVKEFDKWAAKHLPSPSVLYAGPFGAQGGGGNLLDLTEGARKAVVLRVLGIEELEGLAKDARARAAEASAAYATVVARIKDETERGLDIAVAEAQLKEAQVTGVRVGLAVIKAEADLESAEAAAPDIAAKLAKADADKLKVAELSAEYDSIKDELRQVNERLANNKKLLADGEAIRYAVGRLPDVIAQLELAQTQRSRFELEIANANGERRTLEHAAMELRRRSDAAKTRIVTATRRLKDRAAVADAVAKLPELKEALAEAEVDEKLRADDRAKAHAAVLDVATKRLGILRPALDEIARDTFPGVDANGIACDAIAGDDLAVKDAAEAPERIRLADQRYAEAQRTTRLARDLLGANQAFAARAGELAAAETELTEANSELATVTSELATTDANLGGIIKKGRQLAESHADYAKIATECSAMKAELDTSARLAPKLEAAEARIAELEPQSHKLGLDCERIALQVAVLTPDQEEAPSDPDELVARAKKALDVATEAAKHATGMAAVAVARVESAKLTAAKLAELSTERDAIAEDLADWNLWADTLGRDGLQAMEIDCAGPELTELTNDLLRTCFGTRWTASFVTTRTNKQGEQVEDFDIRVIDTQQSREGSADTLSGGEKVVVGEAVSLGLSMLACRRAGLEGVTLVRDESGAALDPANARAYIAMLRRAAELIGASKVLFVSHSPEVIDLADARVEIKDGKVSVAA